MAAPPDRTSADRSPVRPASRLLAALLAAAWPLFVGALLADLAYASSYEIQWINFAAWLLLGGMVFAALALLRALVALIRARPRRGRPLLSVLLLLALFVLGLVDNLVHARDGYATMPDGLVLSAIVALLATVAAIVAFAGLRAGEPK